MRDLGHSVAFRLRGRQSNRDAIGAAITLEAGLRAKRSISRRDRGSWLSTPRSCSSGLGKLRKSLSTPRFAGRMDCLRDSKDCRRIIAWRSKKDSKLSPPRPFAVTPPIYATAGPAREARSSAHTRGNLADSTAQGSRLFSARSRRRPSQAQRVARPKLGAAQFLVDEGAGFSRSAAPASTAVTGSFPRAGWKCWRSTLTRLPILRRRALSRAARSSSLTILMATEEVSGHLQHRLSLPVRPSQRPGDSDLLPD